MAELMQEIEFLLDDFDQVCRYGFRTYRAYSPEVLLEHDSRAAAACTYAHIAAEAERRLSRHQPTVEPIDPKMLGGLRTWRIGEIAVVRFKNRTRMGNRTTSPPSKRRLMTAATICRAFLHRPRACR
jgi:hypothetical protein